MIIYLVLLLPAGSSDLPKAWRAAFISLLFGLASNGVYMCHCCYQQCGSLLHCLSTLTIAFAMAVYFCCTGLGVASTGRYPASCPVKPGLSSSEPFRLSSRDYLVCLRKCYSSMVFSMCKAQNHLHIKTAAANKLPEYGIVGDFFTGHCHKIVQELQQTVGFQVLRLPFLNAK